MSESKSAIDRRGNDVEEDCPLCLEPLPPFWDVASRIVMICCGKYICIGCYGKRDAVLDRARAEGTWGKAEEQLDRCCPLCRDKLPTDGCEAMFIQRKLEDGQLPLHMYGQLGLSYLKGDGGVEVDVDRGSEILMLGAEKGDPECQYLLGGRYDDGSNGFPKSRRDAKRWFRAAIEQGHAVAEYNLAIMFRDEGNDAEYLGYLRGSASKGCIEACYNLGRCYYHGENGLQKSTEEAIRWLMPAAERGDHKAMGILGWTICYPDNGQSLWPSKNPNFTKGMHWLRRAAETGDETSTSLLETVEKLASITCFMCDKDAPPANAFLRCSRCRAAWYCSKDCQTQHWKAEEGGHKQFCINWN